MADIMLVDGYNVLGAWPELAAVKEESLEHARAKLMDILASYGAYKDYRVVIVFDAHAVSGTASRSETLPGGAEVVFTAEGETADSYIERLTYQLVRSGQGVYVVTSDRDQQFAVLGSGAWRISARELRLSVLAAEKEVRAGYTEADRQHRRQELGGRVDEEVRKRLDALRRGL
ncbi:NYN domain-containing protein [Anaeroselena agilis]|uniref:NYN domain-containing protein n=1 Tax=Anaeroselena agilis TaxID=3063788 RepID=A0ABU3P114_9FIRM|nr:NYN domain-containing protein [Selenomonadales bacterium 4137-cl]